MKTLSTHRGVKHLPPGLRLWLARLSIWRLKHGSKIAPSLMLLCLSVFSLGVGYATAVRGYWQSTMQLSSTDAPALAAASDNNFRAATRSTTVDWLAAAELGELQAEIVRLRVLFLRLAELAELDDGEFDLDMNFERDFDRHLDRLEGHALPVVHDEPAGIGTSSSLEGSLADSLTDSLALAKQALVHISDQADRVASVFRERRMAHDFRISGLPVADGRISSRYGYRIDPATGRRQLHRGLDLGGRRGSEVFALADGVVTYSGKNGGYGNLVEIEHPDGFRTRYAHNDSVLVPLGHRVRKGQAIATMGSTGRSTGTHVHLEVRHNGRAVDPQLYIR